MTGSIAGSGQSVDQRRHWWVAALGLLLLVAGGTLLLIVLAVVARTAGRESIRDAGGGALAPNLAAVERTAYLSYAGSPAVGDFSMDDFAPEVALAESSARQAMADGSTRLVIEAIGVDAPIQPVGLTDMEEGGLQYRQWQVPNDYAVGWHRNSAGLGLPGNTVLNGHNNVHGAVFRNLGELAYGEEIVLYQGEEAHRYQVAHRELLENDYQPLSVRLDNAKWMLPTTDERLTLISCWPTIGTTHRLIVIATPVNDG